MDDMPYLELRCGIGRIRRKQLEHVDNAAHSPRAHAIVLVLEQTLMGERFGNRHERVAVGLFLVDGAQFVEQRLESRQQIADAHWLARAANKWLIELELLEAMYFFFLLLLLLLLLLFLLNSFSRSSCATPTARCHVAWLRVQFGGFGRWYAVPSLGPNWARRREEVLLWAPAVVELAGDAVSVVM